MTDTCFYNFPNGVENFLETYYEICTAIEDARHKEDSETKEIQEKEGSAGIYELANELTLKFEKEHKGFEWDGEFLEEIEEFLQKELK